MPGQQRVTGVEPPEEEKGAKPTGARIVRGFLNKNMKLKTSCAELLLPLRSKGKKALSVQDPALSNLVKAVQTLKAETRPEKVRETGDLAEAARIYFKRSGLGRDAINLRSMKDEESWKRCLSAKQT